MTTETLPAKRMALREKIKSWLPFPWGKVLRCAFLMVAPCSILFVCQLVSLQGTAAAAEWITGNLMAAGITAVLLFLALLILAGSIRLLSISFLLTAAVPFVLTLISYYRLVINGEPLMLTDFSLMLQFGDVADFAMDRITISRSTGWAIALLAALLLSAVALDIFTKRSRWSVDITVASGALLIFMMTMSALASGYCIEQYKMYATQVDRDRACGVPLSLLSTWLGSEAAPSDEYSELRMKRLLLEMEAALPEQTGEEKPHIIFVMNESFFDLTRLEGLSFDRDPLENYHRLSTEADHGRFYTVTCGGGTGWVEMEAFTGVSKDLLPADQANTELSAEEYEALPSYVRVLQQQGYETIAFHAHTNELYNREQNYPHIGFDQVLFYEPYKTQGTYEGGHFDDNSSADVIISLFEENQSNPTYIYAMTMQNHQPYYAGRYAEDRLLVSGEGFSDEELAVAQCYANGLYDADQMLGRLVEYFSAVDEKVILVFAGDHLPSLYLSDTETVYSKAGFVGSSSSADWSEEEYQKMLSTDYLIWTNYEQGRERSDTSCTAIGAKLLRCAGVDPTPYYAWMARRSEDTLLFHSGKLWVGADGTLISSEDAAVSDYIQACQDVVYDLLYGDGYLKDDICSLAENE